MSSLKSQIAEYMATSEITLTEIETRGPERSTEGRAWWRNPIAAFVSATIVTLAAIGSVALMLPDRTEDVTPTQGPVVTTLPPPTMTRPAVTSTTSATTTTGSPDGAAWLEPNAHVAVEWATTLVLIEADSGRSTLWLTAGDVPPQRAVDVAGTVMAGAVYEDSLWLTGFDDTRGPAVWAVGGDHSVRNVSAPPEAVWVGPIATVADTMWIAGGVPDTAHPESDDTLPGLWRWTGSGWERRGLDTSVFDFGHLGGLDLLIPLGDRLALVGSDRSGAWLFVEINSESWSRHEIVPRELVVGFPVAWYEHDGSMVIVSSDLLERASVFWTSQDLEAWRESTEPSLGLILDVARVGDDLYLLAEEAAGNKALYTLAESGWVPWPPTSD